MPGSLAEGVSPAAMLMGDRGPRRWESWAVGRSDWWWVCTDEPRRWESWAVGRSDWWWVCTDEGRLRCATLSLLSWLSVLVGFGRGPECLKNFTRGSATAATDPYTRAAAVDISHRRPDPTYLPVCRPRLSTPREEGRAGAWGAPHRP